MYGLNGLNELNRVSKHSGLFLHLLQYKFSYIKECHDESIDYWQKIFEK